MKEMMFGLVCASVLYGCGSLQAQQPGIGDPDDTGFDETGDTDEQQLQPFDFPAGLHSRDATVDDFVAKRLAELDQFYVDFKADLTVEMTGENLGYVVDGSGEPVVGNAESPVEYPHVQAIELANTEGHGGNIFLTAGTYGWFRIMTQYSSHSKTVDRLVSSPENPVRLVGQTSETGALRVRFTSPGAGGYTLQMRETSSDENMQIDHLEFYRLRFECGRDCIHVGTYDESVQGSDVVYDGLVFADVEMDGRYQWLERGESTGKWGMHTRNLGKFELLRSHIHNTHWEHGIYVHAPRGEFIAMANTIHDVGRTAFQFTARKDPYLEGEEHPPNNHPIRVYNNYLADTSLADGCAGGSTISLFGRNQQAYIKNNLIEMGYDSFTPGLLDEMNSFCQYTPFTGAITSASFETDGYENSTGPFLIEHNTFRYAQGTGDRAVVTLAAVDEAIFRNNHVTTGNNPVALRIGSAGSAHKATPEFFCVRDNAWIAGETGKTQVMIRDEPVDEWSVLNEGGEPCEAVP
jgi:hypothetical protein